MGTKANPGKYDCYANAEEDEPLFVLLGRDPDAAFLVRLWADMRMTRATMAKDQGDAERAAKDEAKAREAAECATAMDGYRSSKGEFVWWKNPMDVCEFFLKVAQSIKSAAIDAGKTEPEPHPDCVYNQCRTPDVCPPGKCQGPAGGEG